MLSQAHVRLAARPPGTQDKGTGAPKGRPQAASLGVPYAAERSEACPDGAPAVGRKTAAVSARHQPLRTLMAYAGRTVSLFETITGKHKIMRPSSVKNYP